MKKKLKGFLKQGLSPEKLALCVALGGVIGIIPVLGSTTLLCALTAWVLGLNQPAIQSVNYLVYPAQILLLVPFYRMGERIFHVPHVPITMHVLWETTLRAVVAWGIVAPLVAGLLYAILLPVFRRMNRSLLVQ